MGGSLASSVGNDNDNILTHNKGVSIGNTTNKKNEKAFREKGDMVSILGYWNKNTNTLNNGFLGKLNPLEAHNYKLLKDKNIYTN